jgi:hypothetical protein
MSFIDPRYFLADPEVRPFILDQRQDLTAPNVTILGTNRFVVFELVPPRGQVYLIKNFVPYAMQRINVAGVNATFEMIPSADAAGFFAFEPLLNDNSPFIIEQSYNAAKTSGAVSLNNEDRTRTKGIGYISDSPYADAQNAWFNPLFSVLVPGQSLFRVAFSILSPSLADPLPAAGRFGVGGVGGTRRVDFAGCVLVGQQMTEQYYHGLARTLAHKP